MAVRGRTGSPPPAATAGGGVATITAFGKLSEELLDQADRAVQRNKVKAPGRIVSSVEHKMATSEPAKSASGPDRHGAVLSALVSREVRSHLKDYEGDPPEEAFRLGTIAGRAELARLGTPNDLGDTDSDAPSERFRQAVDRGLAPMSNRLVRFWERGGNDQSYSLVSFVKVLIVMAVVAAITAAFAWELLTKHHHWLAWLIIAGLVWSMVWALWRMLRKKAVRSPIALEVGLFALVVLLAVLGTTSIRSTVGSVSPAQGKIVQRSCPATGQCAGPSVKTLSDASATIQSLETVCHVSGASDKCTSLVKRAIANYCADKVQVGELIKVYEEHITIPPDNYNCPAK